MTQLLLEGHNVLTLDEPTNHLDVSSCEALELALLSYEGSMIIISHDRYFLDQVADRILWLEADNWYLTLGGYTEAKAAYDERRIKEKKAKGASNAKGASHNEGASSTSKNSPLAKLKTAVIEDRIIACEERIEDLHSKMADPEIYLNGAKMKELGEAEDVARKELEELEDEYAPRD